MNRNKFGYKFVWIACVTSSLGLANSLAIFAKDPPPQVSKDGLQLQVSTKTRLVYVKPGTTWNQYKRVAILDCFVEFDKNWQRDYNGDETDLSHRVSDGDMNRIKKDLAAEFKKVFTQELQSKGGYQVVNEAAPDVLVVRPAIVNLRVTAPDLMSPGISMTVVRSAGSATLYVELWDSVSNTILARAMDAQADGSGMAQSADSVSNTMAADVILEQWADTLRKHLDAARGKPTD